MNTDSITSLRVILEGAFGRHKEAFEATLGEIGIADIMLGAEILSEAANGGKKLLVCGNGGSGSDAEHFAGEWTGRYKNDRRPLPAMALGSNFASLTAIANDYGFESVFAREVEALGQEGDVLVAISTSGSSKNVLRAIESARAKKMKIIVMTSAKGTHMKPLVDCAIVAQHQETARIQEFHEFVYHVWCEYTDARLPR